MPIEIKMPALSPTMEQGRLAKWLVKAGDEVRSGDLLAEIETDKATMEFEAVDEGTIAEIVVAEGSDGVKVGTVIATLAQDGEDAAADSEVQNSPADEKGEEKSSSAPAPDDAQPTDVDADGEDAVPRAAQATGPVSAEPQDAGPQDVEPQDAEPKDKENRVIASPLARRIAEEKGVDLATLKGSGPRGRIVKADVESAQPGSAKPATAQSQPAKSAAEAAAAPTEAKSSAAAASPAPVAMAEETRALLDARVPHTVEKLSGMRKTIARRLSQSMQQAPHIYLTVDIKLDRLLAMRGEMNATLETQGIKLSVNDMLIKALGKALIEVPECNVTFAGNELIRYSRADVSVAVSIPGGLITPIVQDASGRSLSSIAEAMKDLGARAKAGKLAPEEYLGGTASISNMGMMGIKHFTAVINPPQSTILAIGAGEKRPWLMSDNSLGVATVMTATGSFDHRAVDGADGARLMGAFREYVEAPLGMVT